MRTRLASTLSMLVLSLSMPACIDGEDLEDDVELVEGSDDSKTDQPDLAMTTLDVTRPKSNVGKVGVIKSKKAFKDAFGVDAPSSVNFSDEWVVYYAAGLKTSGGYEATVKRIRLSDTGKTLKITTDLKSPGPSCPVTAAITYPYAVVKIKKPTSPTPTTNRYYRDVSTVDCGATCDGTTIFVPGYESIGASDPRVSCRADEEHCVTSDLGACPQIHPLPPTFCPNGTIETEPSFIPSIDGKECSIPRVHCVTNDTWACPQLAPPPPCPAGTTLAVTTHYVPSADGMECRLPTLYCVTSDCSP
jgi:hypothetical protein